MERSVETFRQHCQDIFNSHNCPICYYIKNPDLIKISTCMKCDTKKSLFLCIICSHVGCGLNVRRHALLHYHETGHKYIMGVKKFEVWDFHLRKYVHKINDDTKTVDNFHTFSQTNAKNNCSCAICQHKRSPKFQKKLACMMCDESQTENLWICLSCNHIGCDRNKNRHAIKHYTYTSHPHGMQLENFSVWNYKEEKYVHSQLHGTVAVQSEINEFASQHTKEDTFVPTTNGSSCPNEPIYNRLEIVKTATAISTGSCYTNEKLSTATELLQQHHEDFVKRMECLERQWQEFGHLTEANKKMITIEKRLLSLTNEKKALEEKLYEHDAKLNKLLTQFAVNSGNSSPIRYVKSDKVEIVSSASLENITLNSSPYTVKTPKTCFCNNNTTRSPKVNSRSFQIEVIYLMFLGLFVHNFLILSLQTAFENFMNLFKF